jgi:exosortase A
LSNLSISTPVCAAESRQEGGAARVWSHALIALALTALAVAWMLRSTVGSMVTIWYGSNTYSCGFVIVPVCAFLVWRVRQRLYNIYPSASFAGVGVFFLCAVLWLAGNIADVQLAEQIAFIGMMEALVWALLGFQTVRALRFPLLFLFLAIPAGESLIEPLQRVTAAFTVAAVRLSGIPAVQDGFLISTPSGDWKIAEACSGIRYLTSSVVVGVLVAGVLFRTWKRRIGFVLISASVPILANALRAYMIVVLAYISNNQIATGVDHIVYGWIFFSLVTAILIGLAIRWRGHEVAAAEPVVPVLRPLGANIPNRRLLLFASLLIVIAAGATSGAAYLWSRVPAGSPVAALWTGPAGWAATQDADHEWAPSFEEGEATTFTKDSRTVSLYAASYPMKRRGVELVNPGNAVGATSSWKVLNSDYREAEISGKSVVVAEYWIGSPVERRVVWMWYLSGDELTAKPYRIKLMQAESRLAGRPVSVYLFSLSSVVGSQPSEALSNLEEFAETMSFKGLAGSGHVHSRPLQ